MLIETLIEVMKLVVLVNFDLEYREKIKLKEYREKNKINFIYLIKIKLIK